MSNFPSSITAGTTLDRTVVLTAYPAPEWQLSAYLRNDHDITLQAEADGSNHRFHVAATVTAAWHPSEYWYSLRVTNGTDVYEIETGSLTVKPDLSVVHSAYDGRNHVQRVLEAIEAVLEKRASIDQERYRINNRELYRTPISELLALRDRYKAELRRMKAMANGGAGLFNQAARVRFR